MKKKGEMTIGTIVAIALAVVVLVFLVYGFTTGWGNLFEKINIFGGNKVNVDAIKQGCAIDCQQSNEYGYCNEKQKLVTEGKKVIYGSCKNFESDTTLGIGCDNIDCGKPYEQSCSDLGKDDCFKCSDLKGTWKRSCDNTESDKASEVNDEKAPTGNPACCVTKVN